MWGNMRMGHSRIIQQRSRLCVWMAQIISEWLRQMDKEVSSEGHFFPTTEYDEFGKDQMRQLSFL